MTDWMDIASIVFICVTANHLGLISAVERITGKSIPVLNCPKCFTYWSVLVYTVIATHDIITSLAISFLASYTAIWLELFEGFIDLIYIRLYETIATADNNDTASADTTGGDTNCPVPEL